MEAFKQISYRIELGDSAVAVIKKYHNKVELAIYDSEDYVVYLNAHQWLMLFTHSDVISMAITELGLNTLQFPVPQVKRVQFVKPS
jgi:hypothetical protein